MAQLVVRINPDLLNRVDSLVADGEFESRSDAVRKALEGCLDEIRRRRIGRAIVEGYTRFPQTEEEFVEMGFSDRDTLKLVDEEPW